jgi:hypothetical protein
MVFLIKPADVIATISFSISNKKKEKKMLSETNDGPKIRVCVRHTLSAS